MGNAKEIGLTVADSKHKNKKRNDVAACETCAVELGIKPWNVCPECKDVFDPTGRGSIRPYLCMSCLEKILALSNSSTEVINRLEGHEAHCDTELENLPAGHPVANWNLEMSYLMRELIELAQGIPETFGEIKVGFIQAHLKRALHHADWLRSKLDYRDNGTTDTSR